MTRIFVIAGAAGLLLAGTTAVALAQNAGNAAPPAYNNGYSNNGTAGSAMNNNAGNYGAGTAGTNQNGTYGAAGERG